MSTNTPAPTGNPSIYVFPFHNVRHISSPEDAANNRKVYVGQAPLSSILKLNADENVRDYLLEGKKKPIPTQVHRAIRETLTKNPEDFSVLNSGIVIVTRSCEIDEKNRRLELIAPSIINGSQTQGVIKDFYKEHEEEYKRQRQAPQLPLFQVEQLDPHTKFTEPHIKFEIIVTDDEDLIANISIARNFQNDVMAISIVGRLKQLDELEQSFQRVYSNLRLRKSETDLPYDDNNFINTERLMQVIAALIPQELWLKPGEPNKVYTYSQKTKCLKEFQEIYTAAKNPEHPEHSKYKELYQFYLDVAAQAYELHEKWKIHQGFRGTGLHAIKRDERGRNILEVPDGIIFPILASLSVFAQKTNSGWKINVPPIDNELIQAAKTSYIEVARSNPNAMGKSKACYSALAQITSIVKKYSATYS